MPKTKCETCKFYAVDYLINGYCRELEMEVFVPGLTFCSNHEEEENEDSI